MSTTLSPLHIVTDTPPPPAVVEAQMPQAQRERAAALGGRRHRARLAGDVARLVIVAVATFAVLFVYLGIPLALLAGDRLDSLLHALLFAGAVVVAGAALILALLHSTNLDLDADPSAPVPDAS